MRVLGGLDVEGVQPHAVGSRKARSLLRLLALARGRVIPTRDLVAALWGDAPPAHPADQVAVLVSRLRGVLGKDRIVHIEPGYRLIYDWLDAAELETITAEIERRREAGNISGAASASRLALSLLRSELAELTERTRIPRGSARRWPTCAPGSGELGGSQRHRSSMRAVGWRRPTWARRTCGATPYDEDALRLLMRANHAGGRPGVALAAYAEFRDRLAEELGADPSPETSELHVRVLRDDAAPAVAASRGQDGFVGRSGPARPPGRPGRAGSDGRDPARCGGGGGWHRQDGAAVGVVGGAARGR